MTWLGDFAPGDTIDFKFTTRRFSTGAPHALSGGTIRAYKANSTTEDDSGITLTADFDSVIGLNHVRVDTSADGTFYSAGAQIEMVITAGTVDSVSVVGEVIGRFTLNATDDDVDAIKAKTDLIPGTQDGLTFAQVCMLVASVLLGKASGLGTTTAVYRSPDDGEDRVTATVDADGNRSAVTLNTA